MVTELLAQVEIPMDTFNKALLLKAADWFECRYGIRLPPIWLAKALPPTPDGRPVWGEYSQWWGEDGKLVENGPAHITISEQANTLLAFFHEAHHILLNTEKGRWMRDDEDGVETLVRKRAETDLREFVST